MTRAHGKRFMGIPDEFWIGFVIMVGFFLKLVYVIHLGFTSGTLNPGAWSDLTAGQFSRITVNVLFDTHGLADFLNAGIDLALFPFHVFQTEGNISVNRHMRPQCIVLEQESDVTLVR